jgi:hypothetical protein
LLARIPAKTGGTAADGDLRDAGGVCAAIFRFKSLPLRYLNPCISVQSSPRGSRLVASLFPLKIMISKASDCIHSVLLRAAIRLFTVALAVGAALHAMGEGYTWETQNRKRDIEKAEAG